jgi:hypothetical protein
MYYPDSEGGEDPKKVDPPKGYAQVSVKQRKDWNDFLDYLQGQGIGGKADLDKRDQSLGLSYLNKYNKENPDKAIDQNSIKNIQYEQYMLRKGDSFPGLKPEELNYIRQGLKRPDGTSPFLERPVSDIDGWLGSVTSRLYYPSSTRGKNTGEHYSFGVDLESYVRSLNDPELEKKYLTKK